ncbi:MAG: dipeptide/oligopeptide/nickel ABC transporter permease/ATP-binding protein [Promicromonosporaceae bacterium]|nr:dipeptide/oligopeptide/nickel ABC transporter permease/ATP-binding protein [Promicromonosporaceae bacterium]
MSKQNNAPPTALKRLLRDPQAIVVISILVILGLAIIIGPLLSQFDPARTDLGSALAPMGENGHILGADSAGRDILTRLLFGGRNSILGALLAVSVAVGIGTTSGLIAGYFGKWFDTLSNNAASLLQAVPGMVILLAARSVIGPSMWWMMAIFGVLLSAGTFRLVRSTVHSVRNELYVDAARVSGLTDWRIIFKHVLRVVRGPVLIQAGFLMMIGLAIQAGIEILGLGDPGMISWGGMLSDAFARILVAPQLMLWPSVMLATFCLCLTLLANSLRDALDGTQRTSPATIRKVNREIRAEMAAEAAFYADNPIMMGEDELLHIEALKVGYAAPDGSITEIIHGIDLQVNRGEVVGLIGESGSGKTQTAFAAMRLLSEGGSILSGRVVWKGRDLSTVSEAEMSTIRGTEIAYIPQEPMSNLDPSFTIGYQLMEPMRHHLRISKKEARARALDLLRRVEITDPERVFKSYPHQVSGGMAQRVLIAASISCEPDLLIADEPTTALDVTVQAEILDLLRKVQAETGVGILMVTHNFGIVADLCDRVAVMQLGEIVERGDTVTMFKTHDHPYTKQLFSAILDPEEIREPYVAPSGAPSPAAASLVDTSLVEEAEGRLETKTVSKGASA